MTFVEFFDFESVKNLYSSLTSIPVRIIFVGSSVKHMKLYKERYGELFAKRGYDVEIICLSYVKKDIDSAVNVLQNILDKYDDCVFDITGGESPLVLALGMILSKNPDKNIQIHGFNNSTNTFYDYDKDSKTVFKEIPSLSCEEIIRIHGGDIAYGGVSSAKTYLWDMNEEFICDIDKMWELCRKNPTQWNSRVVELMSVPREGDPFGNGLSVAVTKGSCEADKYRGIIEFITPLVKKGLIKDFREDEKNIYLTYKNKQVKKCLEKSGQVFEMKLFSLIYRVRNKKGERVYNDALNGVVIDWDGIYHNEEKEYVFDTENEIDLLVMKDSVPIFISCKNGEYTTEELYKLNTVAHRFGGSYAKKVLFAAKPLDDKRSGHLWQRAKDMGIRLIDGTASFSDKDFIQALLAMSEKVQ